MFFCGSLITYKFECKMKYRVIFLAFLLLTHFLYGQKKYIFKELKADTTSAIIGVCSYGSDQRDYKKYAFFIDKKADLLKVSQSFFCGSITKIDTMDNDLTIFMINKKEAMPIQLGISPKYGYFNVDNNYYTFDITQLEMLANTFPLNYYTKLVKFKTESEYNKFIDKHKNDTAFLCFEDITEELEGITTISIKIENSDKPADKGWNIIEKDLQKIGAKKNEDYILSYTPTFDNTHIYKFQVRLNKKTYDKLNNPMYSKSSWTMNVKEIITYWRK